MFDLASQFGAFAGEAGDDGTVFHPSILPPAPRRGRRGRWCVCYIMPYFSDKREVLFWRGDALQSRIVSAVEHAPENTSPLAVVLGALEATSDFFDGDRANVTQRLNIVAAHPEFVEREMLKLQALTSAIRATLETRGVEAPTARMASEIGVAVSRVALERWLTDTAERDFAHHTRCSRDELAKVVLKDG